MLEAQPVELEAELDAARDALAGQVAVDAHALGSFAAHPAGPREVAAALRAVHAVHVPHERVKMTALEKFGETTAEVALGDGISATVRVRLSPRGGEEAAGKGVQQEVGKAE
jgi:ribosomal protein L9